MNKENEQMLKEAERAGLPLILYGAGKFGKEAAWRISREYPGITIKCYFDNDWTLWGKRVIGELYCERPSRTEGAACLVTTSVRYQEELTECAKGLGFETIYVWHTEKGERPDPGLNRYINLLNARTPRKKMYYVVDLVEHCNLNCQMCDHFSPLSEKNFMSLESFRRDTKRMAELFPGEITLLRLEGGEPLLHPDLSDFVREAARILPDTSIHILTNGLLLPKMEESFWAACKEAGVTLAVTKYPISFSYEEAERIAGEHGVELRYYDGAKEVKTSMHKPVDMKGSQNPYDNFHQCYMANADCAELKDGRLYPCTFSANLHIFNSYFGTKLELGARDFIDIHPPVTGDEIMTFLSNPIPACRYCRVADWTYGHPWKQSSKSIEEWT